MLGQVAIFGQVVMLGQVAIKKSPVFADSMYAAVMLTICSMPP